MKNTKKLLMIFCAIAVLSATVFSIISTAVVAGDGTSVDEYVNMNLSVTDNFERGLNGIAGNVRNGGVGGTMLTNNVRKGVTGIYDPEGSRSKYFYYIDYTTNLSGGDWYTQPTLGDPKKAEKTPENGFVSEFDIAFFSPTTPIFVQAVDEETGELKWQMATVTIDGVVHQVPKLDDDGNMIPIMTEKLVPLLQPKKDENGNVIYQYAYEIETDKNGNYVYEVEKDENGNIVYEVEKNVYGNTKYEVKKDAAGNDVYIENEDGTKVKDYVLDENGNKIPVYKLDVNGEKIPVYVYDEMGEKVPVYRMANGAKIPVYTNDDKGNKVQAYKTDFYGDPVPEYEPVYETVDGKQQMVMVPQVIKGNFVGLDRNFNISMLNTHTYKDGQVTLMSMTTNAATRTVAVNIGGKVVHTFRADEWCHITVQYDAKTLLTYVYAGRDSDERDTDGDGVADAFGRTLLATLNTVVKIENKGNALGNVYPLQFRLGCASNGGFVAMDNFLSYQGTTIHDPMYVNAMPAYEKFMYMVGILESEAPEDADEAERKAYPTAVNRYQAYSQLKNTEELLLVAAGNYYGFDANGDKIITSDIPRDVREALTEDIAIFKSYQADEQDGDKTTETFGIYDKLVEKVKIENVALYLEYANSAYNLKRTFSNAADREKFVSMAEEFYAGVSSLIDRSADDYMLAVERIEFVKENIESDKASAEFITLMNIFNNSVQHGASVARLKAHYANAQKYYPRISTDYTGLDEANMNTLEDAKASYLAAESTIFAETKSVNSARFVNIILLMKKYNIDDLESDDGTVEALWNRALDILVEGEYDPEYQGFKSAMVIYNDVNDYFWENLQQEHVSVLKERLDQYNHKDSTYIERAGICTYVDRYLEINEGYVDYSHEDIKKQVERNETYKGRLGTLEGDYKKVLIENTTKFVNVMKDAAEFDTYAQLKPLFDQATEYYYAMNIEDSTELYILQYEELRNSLERIEADSQAYVDIVNGNVYDADGNAIYGVLSTLTDRNEIYKSLVGCYLCEENLDITYPGAAQAKAVYDSKYQEYNGATDTDNERFKNSEAVVYAVRGNWDLDNIVAFVRNFFN